MVQKKLSIIGSSTLIQIQGIAKHVPSKVDTGADSSSIWASHVYVDDDKRLHYVLFGEWSALYDGIERVTDTYKVVHVTSSNGQGERRYKVPLTITLEGRKMVVWFTLTDSRSQQFFPVLIGRRTVHGKFLVDVSKHVVKRPRKPTTDHIKDFHTNPHKYLKQESSDKTKGVKVK